MPESVTAAVRGVERQHSCEASLDHAVVLLDDVIEITACAHRHGLPPRILLAEQAQTAMGCDVAVEIDLFRPGSRHLHGLAEELLRGFYS